jgi:hypothetical protein
MWRIHGWRWIRNAVFNDCLAWINHERRRHTNHAQAAPKFQWLRRWAFDVQIASVEQCRRRDVLHKVDRRYTVISRRIAMAGGRGLLESIP